MSCVCFYLHVLYFIRYTFAVLMNKPQSIKLFILFYLLINFRFIFMSCLVCYPRQWLLPIVGACMNVVFTYICADERCECLVVGPRGARRYSFHIWRTASSRSVHKAWNLVSLFDQRIDSITVGSASFPPTTWPTTKVPK